MKKVKRKKYKLSVIKKERERERGREGKREGGMEGGRQGRKERRKCKWSLEAGQGKEIDFPLGPPDRNTTLLIHGY